MKKGSFFKSLPFKLLVAVILGILSGLVLNRYSTNGISMAVLNIVVTVKYILGQIITFCVPLIVLGFIAPSITKLGKNASVMLGVAVVLAYGSSIGAALFSTASGFFIIPHLSIHSYAAGLKQLPEVIFELEIPQIMSVMSALVFSVMIGLAATWTKAKLVTGLLDEFQKIVLALVSKIIIPILPLFIGSTFCGLAYEGTITRQLPVFLEIIVLVLTGHFIWMAFLYILAGIYSGENPLEVVRHYAPAYLTAVGTMSSAATLAVALQCASRAKPLRKDLVNFGIPSVCKYSSLRFRSYRSFLLYGCFQDPVRLCSDARNYGSVLSASRCIRHRRSRCPRRNCYGIPWHHYRCAEIRQFRYCTDDYYFCLAGQLRNCMQCNRRWCPDTDAYRLCKTS